MPARSDNLSLIALYHFACGLGNLVVMCGILSVPFIVGVSTAASNSPDGAQATAIVGVIGLLAGGLFLVLAVANFVVGWGLWMRREWARLAAIVLAFLRLINIPFGTVIGGLIIWYLLQEHGRAEFLPA